MEEEKKLSHDQSARSLGDDSKSGNSRKSEAGLNQTQVTAS